MSKENIVKAFWRNQLPSSGLSAGSLIHSHSLCKVGIQNGGGSYAVEICLRPDQKQHPV